MLKVLLLLVSVELLSACQFGIELGHKNVPLSPQIASECPPGLAEQAAKKGAEYAKSQADFEALKKVAK